MTFVIAVLYHIVVEGVRPVVGINIGPRTFFFVLRRQSENDIRINPAKEIIDFFKIFDIIQVDEARRTTGFRGAPRAFFFTPN